MQAFDNRDGTIWFDGQFIPWKEATIHVLTHSLHYGMSVFEGVRIYKGNPFKLRKHIERLHESARLVGFQIPFSIEEIIEGANEIIKKQNIYDGYMRPFAWLGSESMLISANNCKVHLAIAAWEAFEGKRVELRERGVKLNISDWRRAPSECTPFQSKASGNYMLSTQIINTAKAKGFDDSLILDLNGYVTEATTSNFFGIQENSLITPKKGSFLMGITRATIIDIAKTLGIEVKETNLTLKDLESFNSAFLTGTAIEIMPIQSISVEGKTHNLDTKNKMLFQLSESYKDMCNGVNS